ncbi:hypothetical protein FRC07_013564, partial [Ceratobasidium sp. 392]
MAATYLPADIYHKLFERDPTSVRLCPETIYSPDLTPQIKSLKLPDNSDAPHPLIASLHLLNDDIKSAHSIAEP